jgi:hypothetical protein
LAQWDHLDCLIVTSRRPWPPGFFSTGSPLGRPVVCLEQADHLEILLHVRQSVRTCKCTSAIMHSFTTSSHLHNNLHIHLHCRTICRLILRFFCFYWANYLNWVQLGK